jgi:uncharacterized protein YndB with AHSA1/START domain
MKNTGTLEVSTPSERAIVLTRVFHAPRSMVFDALTRPELLKRWFGPRAESYDKLAELLAETAVTQGSHGQR